MKRTVEEEIERLERQKNNIRYADLERVCQEHFGSPRIGKGSHRTFRMPWPGYPKINLQAVKGKAKPYQVMQVVDALLALIEHKKAEEMKSVKGDARHVTEQE
jgi:hypothetical protein